MRGNFISILKTIYVFSAEKPVPWGLCSRLFVEYLFSSPNENFFEFFRTHMIVLIFHHSLNIFCLSKWEKRKNISFFFLIRFSFSSIMLCGDTVPDVHGCCSGMENTTMSSTCDAASGRTFPFATQLADLTISFESAVALSSIRKKRDLMRKTRESLHHRCIVHI